MKLTPKQLSLLKLIQRSLKGQKEWATVSDVCWPLLEGVPPELAITKNDETGKFVRFTEEGKTLINWL